MQIHTKCNQIKLESHFMIKSIYRTVEDGKCLAMKIEAQTKIDNCKMLEISGEYVLFESHFYQTKCFLTFRDQLKLLISLWTHGYWK